MMCVVTMKANYYPGAAERCVRKVAVSGRAWEDLCAYCPVCPNKKSKVHDDYSVSIEF